MSRHLQVFPELLEFPMRLGTDTLLTASLRNASPSYLAFKVKTTATDRYRVRPNLGVVAPGETAHVKLVLVAQDEFGSQLSSCRDRFLVQSLPIMPGQKPDGAAFRAQKFKVQDHKLRVSIVQVHDSTFPEGTGTNGNNSAEKGGSGSKRLNTVASPLEKEIRTSLMSIAEEQGTDGHRSCLTKFSELLLLNGIISTQQMGVALDLVEALFDQEMERPDIKSRNRSVHTWLEVDDESEKNSEGGRSPPAPKGDRGFGLATIQSADPISESSNRSPSRVRARPPPLLTPLPDPHTGRLEDLFPSPPESPSSGDAQTHELAPSANALSMSTKTPPFGSPALDRAPLREEGHADDAGGGSGLDASQMVAAAARRMGSATGPDGSAPRSPSLGGAPGLAVSRFPACDDSEGSFDRGGSRNGPGRHSIGSETGGRLASPTKFGRQGGIDSGRGLPDSPARDLAAMLRSTLLHSPQRSDPPHPPKESLLESPE